MTKGILMFAHNNSEIDYFRMAVVNALLIKRHLGVSVCVVTDQHSYDHGKELLTESVIDSAIDDLIISQKDREFKYSNSKIYRDTNNTEKMLSFYNLDRADAYDLSPYDETILLDTDYLILSDALNQCWGSKNDFMMNYDWQDINFNRKFNLDRLSPSSITMYWATVVYFTKSEYSDTFFTMCKHIRENINYYHSLYKWSGKIYRNDYVFSIASHMLNGLNDKNTTQLPFKLYKTFDYDDIHSATSDSEIVMYLEKHDSPGEYVLSKWRDLDLHVMNKWAINPVSDDLLGYLL
jgi:hypothetical protein